MRKEEIHERLTAQAFDFFYWFSRFEFALKEHGYLKNQQEGANAEPCWEDFVASYSEQFVITRDSYRLISLDPKRQKVGKNKKLVWKSVGRQGCNNTLCMVVRLLKTIRNNLFHGGKHGADGWDDPKRMQDLLAAGKNVLDQLAKMADWEADYTQYY
ncbi:TPA: hypothetical protein ACX6RP_003417 [Photobacterium damselae]